MIAAPLALLICARNPRFPPLSSVPHLEQYAQHSHEEQLRAAVARAAEEGEARGRKISAQDDMAKRDELQKKLSDTEADFRFVFITGLAATGFPAGELLPMAQCSPRACADVEELAETVCHTSTVSPQRITL